MTVIVTKKPGGITQLFNSTTGKVTYKSKSETAFMPIEAFGGIVKFTRKGAMATVSGEVIALDSCEVIKQDDAFFKDALSRVIQAHKDFSHDQNKSYQNQIKELENQFSNL